MIHVCVIGATGFISSHIIKQLESVIHATVHDVNNKERYKLLLDIPNSKDRHVSIFLGIIGRLLSQYYTCIFTFLLNTH
jgi:nucleoside-diphosphate-sugar epimerase